MRASMNLAGVVVLLALAMPAQASILAYEGFDYTAGSAVAGNGSLGAGWAGSWTGETAASVSSATMTYGSLSTSGNSWRSGVDVNVRTLRSLDASASGTFGTAGLVDSNGYIGQDGTTLYFSFLEQISVVPGTYPDDLRYYAVELNKDTRNYDPNRVLLIGHDDTLSTYYSAANKLSGTSTSLGAEDTNVNFYVVKLTFGTGNNDTATIYRNASLTGEPAVAAATLTGDFSTKSMNIGRFVGVNPVLNVDEIRFGTTYADVVPIPEPSMVAMLTVALFALTAYAWRKRK